MELCSNLALQSLDSLISTRRNSEECLKISQELHQLLKSSGKSLKSSELSGRLPKILPLLDRHRDPEITLTLIEVLKLAVLSKSGGKQCARNLANGGGVEAMFQLLCRRHATLPLPSLLSVYRLLALCGKHDRRFAVKARLLSAVSIPLDQLQTKQASLCPPLALAALRILRPILANRTNSVLLGRKNVVQVLLTFLQVRQKPNLKMAYVLECLGWAVKSKRNVLSLIEHNGIPLLLAVLEKGRVIDSTVKSSLRLRKINTRVASALLLSLQHVAAFKAGRRILNKCHACEVLLACCDQKKNSSSGEKIDEALLTGCSKVLQKCLPPVRLPLDKGSNVMFKYKADILAPRRPKTPANLDSDGEEASCSFDDENAAGRTSASGCVSRRSSLTLSSSSMICDDPTDLERRASKFFPELTEESTKTPQWSSCLGVDETPLQYYTSQATSVVRNILPRTCMSAAEISLIREDVYPMALQPLHDRGASGYRKALLSHVRHHRDGDLVRFSQMPSVYNIEKHPNVAPTATDDSLIFESRFDGGNLRKAIRVRCFTFLRFFEIGTREYNLLLSPDINLVQNHYWFYFAVSGATPGIPYTLNVINMDKRGSLYLKGLSPLLFAEGRWSRIGTQKEFAIALYKNHYRLGSRTYFTLSFTLTFPTADACYLSSALPYGYNLLRTHLALLPRPDYLFMDQRSLCESVAGNSCDLITITASPVDRNNCCCLLSLFEIVNRPHVFLMGRVHPSESNTSWIVKGVLDYLTSNRPGAQRLNELFIFKIVPMLNIDGVINGSQRCSPSGDDLNRQWMSPDPKRHPTIYAVRSLVEYLATKQRVPMFMCDFHGHTRQYNAFIYGCDELCPVMDSPENSNVNSNRVFPLLLHRLCSLFNARQCYYAVENTKRGTARVAFWRQFGVPLSYTLECSMVGGDQGICEGYHFGVPELKQIGEKFCEALLQMGNNLSVIRGMYCQLKLPPSHQRGSGVSESSNSSESSSALSQYNSNGEEDEEEEGNGGGGEKERAHSSSSASVN